MAVLVNYSSSEEDDKDVSDHLNDTNAQILSSPKVPECDSKGDISNGKASRSSRNPASDHSTLSAPLIGPSQCPEIESECTLPDDPIFNKLSPYSKNRAMLRNLTIPTLPYYNIPQSPLGSPRVETETKFNNFLELKSQGVHFNQKLTKSAALKNPSLAQKLMDFAKIDEIGQYSTTLPKTHWDPSAFPNYAYQEELSKSQIKIRKKKDDEKIRVQRETINFISGTSSVEVGVFGMMPKSKHMPYCGNK